MIRLRLFAFALVAAVAVAVACAGPRRDPRFPKRPPSCTLAIYHNMPEVKVWDDIGPVQVDCYLDESEVICLSRLRAEACRMGGDIIYNVPSRALRPVERGMVYRGNVAHTRAVEKKHDEAPAPADAGSGGPIEPLLPATAAVAPHAPVTDGGGQ